jgi:phosphate-selective porin
MLLSAQAVSAQTTAAAQTPGGADTRSIYDKIWQEVTTIYDDSSNPVVQRVLFTGRFQHDFAAIDADQGDHDEWNTRRLRVGPRITLFRTFTLHVEADLNPQEIDPLYLRLTDAYLQWSPGARLVVTAGKHSIPYTLDGATSSKALITIDRNNVTSNIWFPQDYLPGVSVAGGIASVILVHRLWHVNAYATLLRAAAIAGPAYWLATVLPASGAVALVAKLVVLGLLVIVAFVALGELDADERRRLRAAWPRRGVMPAESE